MKRRIVLVGVALAVAGASAYYLATSEVDQRTAVDTASRAVAPSEAPQSRPAERTAPSAALSDSDEALGPAILEVYRAPDFVVRMLEDVPPLQGTWSATRAGLIASAESGDPRANYLLYRAAYACYRVPRTQQALEAQIEKATASYPDGEGRLVERPAGADAVVRELRETFEYCKDSDIDDVAGYVHWLEIAAAAGDVRAQLAYGADYPGDNELDASNDSDAATLRERQEQYVAYLEQAKLSGSIDAMSRLAGHYYAQYSDVSIASPTSLKQAVAHLYPYAWYRWKYEGSDRSLRYLETMGNRLTPLDLTEAVEEGKRFLESEKCCFKVPGS